MAQKRIQIGDMFVVRVGESQNKYFQYVADDLSQLNSQVIRVFRESRGSSVSPDLGEIAKGETDFYAHAFLKTGLKLKYWEKAGNALVVGEVEPVFRDSNDVGNLNIKDSEQWYIWKINEPFVTIGKLEGENLDTEIGVVISPDSIVHRIRTGRYDFIYPGPIGKGSLLREQ